MQKDILKNVPQTGPFLKSTVGYHLSLVGEKGGFFVCLFVF